MTAYPDPEISGEIPEEADVKVTAQVREEPHRERLGSAEPLNDTDHMEFPERGDEHLEASSTGFVHGGMLHDELFEKEETTVTPVKILPEELENILGDDN